MGENVEKEQYPKVLIISHNLYDVNNNIGKTLVSLFKGWPKEKLSQIYFRNDMPSFNYCKQYYCITDKEIFFSALYAGRKKAGNFTEINKLGRRRKNKKIPPIFRLNSNHPLNFLENLV